MSIKYSIVIPAKNEEQGLKSVIEGIAQHLDPQQYEVIVVNDGSEDNTESMLREAGINVISHPYSKGNGAAIKTGVRHAKGDFIICMDADGQHSVRDIPQLVEKAEQGFDMVVGARKSSGQAGLLRKIGNSIYNKLASWIVGHNILDLTSGFRIIKASKFREFLYLLPNGFSYPTTITMIFFRAGYSVGYTYIGVAKRQGKSHLRIVKDGIRFFTIILKIGTLYSPLKIFVPIALLLFGLGLSYYSYTLLVDGRFTNMGLLLFISSVFVLLFGLISEQINSLFHRNNSGDR